MGKPKVIVNVASSLDGKIGTEKGALPLSTEEDWIRVHKLRNSVDAIMIGINTVLSDDPLLTIRHVESKSPHPFRVILDSKCRIKLDSQILKNQEYFPTIIFTTDKCSIEKRKQLQEMGVKVEVLHKLEQEQFLDMKEIFRILNENYSVSSILVEGGTSVISYLLKNYLVDVLYVFYRFVMVGDYNTKAIFTDPLMRNFTDALHFNLIDVQKYEKGILMTFSLIKMQE